MNITQIKAYKSNNVTNMFHYSILLFADLLKIKVSYPINVILKVKRQNLNLQLL